VVMALLGGPAAGTFVGGLWPGRVPAQAKA